MRKSFFVGGRSFTALLGLIALAALDGCASSSPAPESPAEGTSEPALTPAPQEPPEAEVAPDASADEWADDTPVEASAAPAEDPGPENALRLCEAICKKMDTACTDRAADFCRASCGDYESGARKCPVEVEAALQCQANADAVLLCSNIAAPSCAPLFKAMQDCRSGAASPKPRNAGSKADEAPPSGFVRLTAPSLRVTQLLPQGARLEKDANGLVRASAADESGVEYSLVQLPDEARAPTDKSILRTATGFVGNDCQPQLRLRGRFESQGVIHVRLDTVCKDGKEHHGILHFFDGHVLVAVATLAPKVAMPQQDVLDAFLFSFERLDAPQENGEENE